MRVLFVSKTLAEFPEEIGKVRQMANLGVDLSVVIPQRWRGRHVDVDKMRSSRYRLLPQTCCFSDRESRRLRYHLHFYPGISTLAHEREWDLVHVDEEPMNFATYYTFKQCRERSHPLIFTTWQNLMKNYPPPFNFFERYVLRNSAGAFAGNQEAAGILRRRGFQGPVACAPQHGVDSALFRRLDATPLRDRMGLNDAFVVGFVGQIAYRKGIDTILKAMKMLQQDCVPVLVGSGPDARRFASMARQLNVFTSWQDWVEKEEIPTYMNLFDVLVLPSRTLPGWKEQFGRVLIEAMACETPVVGSDSGEIPNVVGDAGLIFHEGNEQELAAQLSKLINDPNLRKELGRRGRERVLKHFTYEKVAAQTVEFYKRICSGGAETAQEHVQPDFVNLTS